jgi:KRAB domain-containing zinc finger protein
VKPFKCDHCDYSTVERSHLKVHIRVHTGEKPYKCTYCEYATAQNSTLKIHLKRHHCASTGVSTGNTVSSSSMVPSSSQSDVTFVCSTCGQHFEQRDTFTTHTVSVHATDSGNEVTKVEDHAHLLNSALSPNSGNRSS